MKAKKEVNPRKGDVMTEHEHHWGEWKKMLWYTPEGRFVGEARICEKCQAVETRDVKVDPRPAVAQPTIGVFAGIFNKEGKILLKKITSGRFVGEWDLPGGGVDAQRASQSPDERLFWQEIKRLVQEETGISISVGPDSRIPTPAILKGGGDWAFPIVVPGFSKESSKGETKYFSPKEVQELARGTEGNRLLSGENKRMYRLTMRLLCHSPNPKYAEEAKRVLKQTYKKIGLPTSKSSLKEKALQFFRSAIFYFLKFVKINLCNLEFFETKT